MWAKKMPLVLDKSGEKGEVDMQATCWSFKGMKD